MTEPLPRPKPAPDARVHQAVVLDALRAVLRERGEVVVPPAGFSMGGRYLRADGLVLQPLQGSVRWGEVVAFARGDRWVLHRVVAVCGDRVWTKGDALATLDDPPVARSALEARLVARMQAGRRCPETRWYAAWALLRGGWHWLLRRR